MYMKKSNHRRPALILLSLVLAITLAVGIFSVGASVTSPTCTVVFNFPDGTTQTKEFPNGHVVTFEDMPEPPEGRFWGIILSGTTPLFHYTVTEDLQVFPFTRNHVHENTYTLTTPPTCTENGSTTYYCVKCGLKGETGNLVSALGHDWDQGQTLEGPTCSTAGKAHFTCLREGCGFSEIREIEKLPHTPGEAQREDEVSATCEDRGGYQMVVRCTVCQEIVSSEAFVIEAYGHMPGEAKKENQIPATCTSEGSYDLVTYCTVCGKVLNSEHIVEAVLSHTEGEPQKENEIPAACTSEGSYDLTTYCTVCGTAVKRETAIVPMLGHTAGEPREEKRIPATCTAEGSFDRITDCQTCGEILSSEHVVVPALGHAPGEALKCDEIPATCTAEGSYNLVTSCTVCGEQIASEHRIVGMLSHTEGQHTAEDVVEPNCETAGSFIDVIFCAVCGNEMSRTQQTIDPLGHMPAEEAVRVVTLEPTCKAAGAYEMQILCLTCQSILEVESSGTVEMLAHSWGQWTVIEATCGVDGVQSRTCGACGDVEEQVLSATNAHIWNQGDVTAPATCTGNGVMTYTCTVCSATKAEVIPATHRLSRVLAVAPTCGADGNITYWMCLECHKIFADQGATQELTTVVDPATGAHIWDRGTVTTPASCLTNGVKTYMCAVCQQTKAEVIPGGHKLTQVSAVAASCGADGNIAHWNCKVCGRNYLDEAAANEVADVVEKATGLHSWNEGSVTTAATCTTDGVRTYVCGVCMTARQETIPAAHKLAKVEGKEPTCGASGNLLYWSCESCGKMFADEAASQELFQVTLDATGLHSWDEGTIVANATCTADGERRFTCTVCSEIRREKISAGHSLQKVDAVAPTCGTDGNVAHWACEVCGQKFADENGSQTLTGTVDKATGSHRWDLGTIIEKPSCTEEGEKIVTCVVCKQTKTERIPAGHALTKVEAAAPSCSEEGTTEHYHCSACGKNFADQKGTQVLDDVKLPATDDHQWNEGTLTEEGSCIRDGVMTFTCAACKTTKTESVPGKHSLIHMEKKEASCLEDGNEEYYLCEICGKAFSDALAEKEIEVPVIRASGKHTDSDNNSKCDACGEALTPPVKPENPTTGDESSVMVLVAVMAISLLAVCLIFGFRKRII